MMILSIFLYICLIGVIAWLSIALKKTISTLSHEMQINGFNVKAVFNKNIETGEIFLNDAWVIE